MEQVEKQLNKLVDVVKVRVLNEHSIIGRELLLIKVNATVTTRPDIMTICEICGAKIADITANTLTIELSAESDKVASFEEMMRPFGIMETARTGMIALQKGAAKI